MIPFELLSILNQEPISRSRGYEKHEDIFSTQYQLYYGGKLECFDTQDVLCSSIFR